MVISTITMVICWSEIFQNGCKDEESRMGVQHREGVDGIVTIAQNDLLC